jgi:PAS domain S-box-containing protein
MASPPATSPGALIDEVRKHCRELIDATHELIVIHALDGTILLANRAAQELVGRPESDLLRANIKDFIPEAEHGAVRERAATRVAHLSRRMYSYEVTILPRGGAPERLEVNSSPIMEDDTPIAVIVVARFKEGRGARERDLEREKEAAVAANRAKSEFLAHMSHEVRTPISIIYGMTEMALDTELPAEARAYLEKARVAADGLLNLIDDILEFSRAEARRYALRPRAFVLRDRVAMTVGTVATMAQSRGLTLDTDVAAEVPAALVGDPDRLHQVLMNLLTNAIKFTAQGSVRVGVKLAATPAPRGVHLLFSVADTGVGIAVDHRGAIFDPFKQVGHGGGPSEGTGLGLAIARELVSLLGGQIWVESEPGRGSTFYFTALFDEDRSGGRAEGS